MPALRPSGPVGKGPFAAWRPGVSLAAWVKAHLEREEARERGITRHAWEGSRRADELVGQGAAARVVDPAEVERARWAIDATERAQLWMPEALQQAVGADPPRPRQRRQGRRAGVRPPPARGRGR